MSSSEPITINNERIAHVQQEAINVIQQQVQYIIATTDAQTQVTWDTSNGINADIFDTGSTITLTCEKNIRHIVGYLKTKAKDGSNNDITFTPGTAVSVLPNTKFSTSVLRYTDGLPGSWLIEINSVGLRIASTALVTLSGVREITFSYTYLATEAELESEVHTNEAASSP